MNDINHRDIWEYITAKELESGIVRLSDDIQSCSLHDFSKTYNYLLSKKMKYAQLIITSPGGGAYHAFAMYDILKMAENKGLITTGLVEGFAASAASMIVLQGCKHRLSTPLARLHLHEVQQWVFLDVQTASDVQDRAKEMKVLMDMIVKILSERTGRSATELLEFIQRRERWMSAKEALEYGLIDEII
jgi:ATP-dependent Clp protease protease subunit